jgi:hypothetical protein
LLYALIAVLPAVLPLEVSCPKIAINKKVDMDYPQEVIYGARKSPQGHYDERLIQKIVQEVENGLPIKKAERIYGLGKSSLDTGMKQYGSVHYWVFYDYQLHLYNYIRIYSLTCIVILGRVIERLTLVDAS